MQQPSQSTTSPNEEVRSGREQAQQAAHDHEMFKAEAQAKKALSPLQHMSRMAEATDLAQSGIAQHSASQVSELQQKLEEASAPSNLRRQMEGAASALHQNRAANHRAAGEHLRALSRDIMGIEATRSVASAIIRDIGNNVTVTDAKKTS